MKKLFCVLVIAASFAACNSTTETSSDSKAASTDVVPATINTPSGTDVVPATVAVPASTDVTPASTAK